LAQAILAQVTIVQTCAASDCGTYDLSWSSRCETLMGIAPCTGSPQKALIAVTCAADEQVGQPGPRSGFWGPRAFDSRHTAVVLNVYDVGTNGAAAAVNSVLRPMGLGAFHCGVQIRDKEWSYSYVLPDTTGSCSMSTTSGVFACQPQNCPGHSFCEAAPMGYCAISEHDLLELLVKLDREWPSAEYDLLHRNCCHFCQELCSRLGLGTLPSWVTKLAAAGASLALGEVRVADCCTATVAVGSRCTSSCCGPASGVTRVEKVLLVPSPARVERPGPDVDPQIRHPGGPSPHKCGCSPCSRSHAGQHGGIYG